MYYADAAFVQNESNILNDMSEPEGFKFIRKDDSDDNSEGKKLDDL